MSIVKSFDEMNAEQRLAYRIGYGAAQADLANGERVEPDYGAGVRTFKNRYEGGAVSVEELVRQAIDAALGGRLLVDPPKEEEQATPTLIDLVQELRRELGLFDGAMPISPKKAWEEALVVVRGLRRGWCHACEDRYRWATVDPPKEEDRDG